MDLLTRIQELRQRDDFDEVQETDVWLDLMEHRRAEILSEMPVPFCCPFIAGARAVFASCDTVEFTDPPRWLTSYAVAGRGHASVDAHACPFCSTRLPTLVLKKTPPPQVCKSDGYYCGTCTERLNNCLCSHPLSVYEAENAPPDFAVAAFIQKVYPSRRLYLSVSRKGNPDDKGMPGGKIDPGETPREALVRELLEETGLTAIEFHPVFDAQDATGKRCVTYEVTQLAEGLAATEETGVVEWVVQKDLIKPGSTFEKYNQALFHHLDPYSRYG